MLTLTWMLTQRGSVLTGVLVSQDRQEDVLQSDQLQAGRGSGHLQRAAQHQEVHQHGREGEAGPHPGTPLLPLLPRSPLHVSQRPSQRRIVGVSW